MRAAVAAALAIVAVLALPLVASAASIEVDSVGDEAAVTPGICLTLGGDCTLRAAIEAANEDPAEDDVIGFDATVFEGQLADTIVAESPLPTIVGPVHIDGKRCATEAGMTGPCQGIAGSGLIVNGADGVEIDALSVPSVEILGGADEATIRGSWLGVKLDGSADAAGQRITVGPESDWVQIGGAQPNQGNVLSNSWGGVALDIRGATETVVQGNYFGVDPSGKVEMSNQKDIWLHTDQSTGAQTTDTLIGVKPGSGAAATFACDKGCNVIAGAADYGIDIGQANLHLAPTVGTHIAGNFIGFAVNHEAVGAPFAGVAAWEADGTLIGGPEASEANFFTSATFGIYYYVKARDLEAIGNKIGYDARGRQAAAPRAAGIYVARHRPGGAPKIEGNKIAMEEPPFNSNAGIELEGPGGRVVGNEIVGGSHGIHVLGDSSLLGSSIVGNTIKKSEEAGILIENDSNRLRGNEVLRSGGAGIRIQSPDGLLAATDNLIGGDTEADENVISNNAGAAIEIEDLDETDNEVARNHGSANDGLFIDLLPLAGEPLGPNRGIEPPSFSTAAITGASGDGAEPGALVRVFRKADSTPGELASFLGEAIADDDGNWEVTYPGAVAGGATVAVTQTSAGATSELGTTTTVAPVVVVPVDKVPEDKGPDPVVPVAKGPGSPAAGESKPAPDTTAPQVTIAKAPKAKTTSATAQFRFSSSEAVSTFECKLDGQAFKACSSPAKYKKLKPGKHVFRVRATDSAGNVGAAAKWEFTVLLAP